MDAGKGFFPAKLPFSRRIFIDGMARRHNRIYPNGIEARKHVRGLLLGANDDYVCCRCDEFMGNGVDCGAGIG